MAINNNLFGRTALGTNTQILGGAPSGAMPQHGGNAPRTPLYGSNGQEVGINGQPVSGDGLASRPALPATMDAGKAGGQLVPGELANDLSQQSFYGSLQPEQQAAIHHLLALLQNPQGLSDEYRAHAMGQVKQHLPELYNHLQSLGAGIGAQGGSLLAANNMGANNANQFDTSLNSPTGMIGRAQGISDLVASQKPGYQGLSTLSGVQHPNVQHSSDNTLGGIGSIIGGLGAAGLHI